VTAFDALLCVLIVGTALAAVGGRDLFGSVVFFIVYGVLIAIAWTRLGAVDVALAEAAIGAGLTGVILVGAASRLGAAGGDAAAGRGFAAAAAVACAAVAALVAAGFLALPPDAAGLAPAVADHLDASGVENPVTAVLLNFRAYDTLLESIVLLVALVGVWSLAPDGMWPARPGLPQRVRPDGVLATFGRFLPPIGLLVGIYLVWRGADAPGGAFQGGTVLAAVWLIVALAGQAAAPSVADARLRVALIVGPAIFLGIGLVGAFADSFLAIPEAFAKPVILAIEAGLTLSIAATLALLAVGPPAGQAR
jgi:multisubunit Na+/H+ antiporter MnhB subunit